MFISILHDMGAPSRLALSKGDAALKIKNEAFVKPLQF